MQQTKLQFSHQEMSLVSDAGWILTKNEIILKIKGVLEVLYQQQKEYLAGIAPAFPEYLLKNYGKISRGEYYMGLPYLILDYPRIFERENIFAIRSFFWWGRYFSTTLHLSGKWQQYFNEKLLAGFEELSINCYFISACNDEWNHHVDSHSYQYLQNIDKGAFEKKLLQDKFIKIAKHTPILHLNNALNTWQHQFEIIIRILNA